MNAVRNLTTTCITKMGTSARQAALAAIAIATLTTAPLTHAGPSSGPPGEAGLPPIFLPVQDPFELNFTSGIRPGPYGHGQLIGNQKDTKKNQLWLGSVSYSRAVEWMKPFVQNNLKVGVDYTYQFNMTVRARTADGGTAQTPDGWYIMDLAVVIPTVDSIFLKSIGAKDNLNAYDRFITSRTLLVQVTGGSINRKITLRFPNITSTTIVNHLYIQLTPVETTCSKSNGTTEPCVYRTDDGRLDLKRSKLIPLKDYRPYVLDVPFVPYVSSAAGTSSPDDSPISPNPERDATLGDYIQSAIQYHTRRTKKAGSTIKPKDYAKLNKLNYISIRDNSLTTANPQWRQGGSPSDSLLRILNTSGIGSVTLSKDNQELWPTICSLLAAKNQRLIKESKNPYSVLYNSSDIFNRAELCALIPERSFRLSLVEHLYAFDGENTGIQLMQPLRYSLLTSFMVSRSHSTDAIRSLNLTEPVFKVFDAFGIPLRALGFSLTKSVSNSRGLTESASGWITTGLDFNLLALQIPVTSSQRCIEIRAVPQRGSPFYDDQTKNANNGLYICDEISNKPHNVNEIYGHIFVHAGDTSLSDSYSPMTQTVNISLQGDRDISTFFYLTRGAMTPDHDNRVQPFEFLKGARNHFALTPSSSDGLIVNPMTFPSERSPMVSDQTLGGFKQQFIGQ